MWRPGTRTRAAALHWGVREYGWGRCGVKTARCSTVSPAVVDDSLVTPGEIVFIPFRVVAETGGCVGRGVSGAVLFVVL